MLQHLQLTCLRHPHTSQRATAVQDVRVTKAKDILHILCLANLLFPPSLFSVLLRHVK